MARVRRSAPGRSGPVAVRGTRWSQDQAEQVLEEWRRSGASFAAFCRERGLHPERLRRWRRKLARAQSYVSQELAFRPIRIVEDQGREGADAGIELSLSGERRVRLDSDFDPRALRRLLEVLESPCS